MSLVSLQEKFLSRDECNLILEHSLKSLSLTPGLVKNNELIEKVRKSKVAFYDYNQEFIWLHNRLRKYVNSTFPMKGYEIEVEPKLQFTKYSTGEHYNWHKDDGKDILTAKRHRSIVIQLSDEYTGGDLEYKENGIKKFKSNVGSLFTFPSYYSHRVTEVTSGVRYSLVGWFKLTALSNTSNTLI